MDVKSFTAIASTTLFVTALTVNIAFIYIAYNNGKKSIGTYKYLLISFALCNVLYSCTEYASKPAIHICGTSYMAYNNGFYEDSPKWGTLLLCFFYAMYGTGTALLALHFLYRYFIVCKPDQGVYFEVPYISLWIIPILFWGFLYAFIAYYCFGPTEDFYNYADESVRNTLQRSLRSMAFFCIFTHKVENESVTVYWKSSVGLILSTAMMVFTFGLMILCGIKIARRLREMASSKKAIALQKQLLAALSALIPFMLSYLPRSLMFLSVIMGLPPMKIYMFMPLIITASTVLDPIAILLFVTEYRTAFVKFLKIPVRLLLKNNTIVIEQHSVKTNVATTSQS